jgi:hypothetical protein
VLHGNRLLSLIDTPRVLISAPNDGLQLRRAISIQAEGMKLLEKHAIAPSAARLCWAEQGQDGAAYVQRNQQSN